MSKKTGLSDLERVIELKHTVSFEGKGKWKSMIIKIDKEAASKLGIKCI